MQYYRNDLFEIQNQEEKPLKDLYAECISFWGKCNFTEHRAKLSSIKWAEIDPSLNGLSLVVQPNLDDFKNGSTAKAKLINITWNETMSQLFERISPTTMGLNRFMHGLARTKDTVNTHRVPIMKEILNHVRNQAIGAKGRPRVLVFKMLQHPTDYPKPICAGVVSPYYVDISDEEMLDHVSFTLFGNPEFSQFKLNGVKITRNKSKYSFIFPNIEAEILKDDKVHLTLEFYHNRWGRAGLGIRMGLERVICSNGATIPYAISQDVIAHVRKKDETLANAKTRILHRFTKNLTNSIKLFDKFIQLVKRSTEIDVEKPLEQIKEIAKKYSLSDKKAEEVLANFKEHYSTEESLYGIGNAFNHETTDEELMIIAGEVFTWEEPLEIAVATA
jgi:hypothetical protein